MSLETWDPLTKRWVLYSAQAHHSADCELYLFEAIPRRVFLDTCVVNLLVKHAPQVFEQYPVPADVEVQRANDVEALMHVFYVGSRADWDLLAARKTLQEIENTPEIELRKDLLEYALQLVDSPDDLSDYANGLGRRLVESPFTAKLPDRADRELIGNAIGLRCDAFCTSDRRSIIRRRESLRQLPIKVLTPIEWWARVKPWARLWG